MRRIGRQPIKDVTLLYCRGIVGGEAIAGHFFTTPRKKNKRMRNEDTSKTTNHYPLSTIHNSQSTLHPTPNAGPLHPFLFLPLPPS